MRNLLLFVQIFTFADWIIAAFISGTAARIEGRDPEGKSTGKRTALAVGLAIFFGAFAAIRICEFGNMVYHADSLRPVLGQVPQSYTQNAVLIAAAKTLALLFCWFAVTVELRERKGITSANIIRNRLARWFEKLK